MANTLMLLLQLADKKNVWVVLGSPDFCGGAMKSLSRWITQPASATAGACQRASKIKLGLGLI